MSMNRKVLCLFAAVILLMSSNAYAAYHYIRAGATGSADGSDWTNAWTDLPATFVRGDTYYVAEGTYGAHTFNTALSGSDYIYIKRCVDTARATDAVCQGASGWNDTYGDGQAVFTHTTQVWYITTGYWDFDGVVGGGPSSWTSGHGILLQGTSATFNQGIDIAAAGTGSTVPSNLFFRHLEIDCTSSYDTTYNGGIGIEFTPAMATVGNSTCTVEYCYIHHVNICAIKTGTQSRTYDWTVQYSWFAHRKTSGSTHGELFALDYTSEYGGWTIRYNVFRDSNGTGVIVVKSGNDAGGVNQRNWRIYGNVFFDDPTSAGTSNATVCDVSSDLDSIDDSYFYNNTLVNMVGIGGSIGFAPSQGTGNVCYNNLFYNAGRPIGFTCTHDYNAADEDLSEDNDQTNITSAIFQDYANDDFRLVSATLGGTSLVSPYNTDMYGNVRGADGTWDRGAYEYDEGSSGSSATGCTIQGGSFR